MTSSLLQNKRFYCREWTFSKIGHCLENRTSAKTCGTLIVGGPGCGKSALCCELVWPTSSFGKQQELNKRILAYYFCQAHDAETLSVANFVNSLVDQIFKSPLLHGYHEFLQDPSVKDLLDPARCDRDPDSAFKNGVLTPLASIIAPPQNLFILVDSIDESCLQSASEQSGSSGSIAELLGRHHHLFPQWLLLVCSARKQSKSITRMFTGFRKISLDDLRKSHVIRDVQQYILNRLDCEDRLRQHLSRETAETLNQLHIKCNGCFLYLEKVLNSVIENFVLLKEIRDIPGTLNGLYLWLCQRLFPGNQFVSVQPILNVILAARRPLTELELYSCLVTRNTQLNFEEFQIQMNALAQILIEGQDGTKILFHHSFSEWLLDVKHCTPKYLCLTADGHAMLALSFTLHAPSLMPLEVQDLALHLARSNFKPPFENFHSVLWLILSGTNVEDSLTAGLPLDQSVLKLLLSSGAKMPSEDVLASTNNALSFCIGDCETLEDQFKRDNDLEEVMRLDKFDSSSNKSLDRDIEVDFVDKSGQTALSLAVRQGNADAVSKLVQAGASINHSDNDGWTVLRSAAWGGHLEIINILLAAGVEVDQADKDGRTALRAAAWGGHNEIVLRLLKHGADVNKVDKEGRTALIAAAYMGHANIVEYMLSYGADINHEDIDGRTALSVAALCIPASEGHLKVVNLLLERGAEVNHCDKDAMTPLLVASYEGHHDVCELLLENDADIDHSDNSGRTALQAAVSMGHNAVVSLLLFWGAAVDMIDSDGRTVLGIAAQQGNVDIVRQLLNRGMDEMHRDNSGWTPLHIAAYEGHKEVVDALLEAGARVLEVDNDGRIPLILAAQEGHLAVVSTLVDIGSPVGARGHDGKTALRSAALESHQEVVHFLLCRNADVNYKDADGRSTLYILALDNRVPMATLFLDHHADIESCDHEGRTPLHVASWQGHYEMVELLLSRSANANSVDNDRRTPIQSAAWQGRHHIVELLLEHGAIVDHTCNQGATALCIAAQEGHEDVVKVLLRYGANLNHADRCGRTPMRVATKGGHAALVKILREYSSCSQTVDPSCSKRTCTIPSSSSGVSSLDGKYMNSTSHALASARAIANGYVASDMPSSSLSGNLSGYSKSSHNPHVASNSTCQSSSSSGNESGSKSALSFTQQLQQCSESRRRNKSNALSPVQEPGLASHSPGSPLSEVHSCKASPGFGSPDIGDKMLASNYISSRVPAKNCPDEMIIEPIWQRQMDRPNAGALPVNRMGAMVMGQTALIMNSPEFRRKRNGIITNPCYSPTAPDVATGIVGSASNFASDSLGNSGLDSDGDQSKTASNASKASRPKGLPLKRETPL